MCVFTCDIVLHISFSMMGPREPEVNGADLGRHEPHGTSRCSAASASFDKALICGLGFRGFNFADFFGFLSFFRQGLKLIYGVVLGGFRADL